MEEISRGGDEFGSGELVSKRRYLGSKVVVGASLKVIVGTDGRRLRGTDDMLVDANVDRLPFHDGGSRFGGGRGHRGGRGLLVIRCHVN